MLQVRGTKRFDDGYGEGIRPGFSAHPFKADTAHESLLSCVSCSGRCARSLCTELIALAFGCCWMLRLSVLTCDHALLHVCLPIALLPGTCSLSLLADGCHLIAMRALQM